MDLTTESQIHKAKLDRIKDRKRNSAIIVTNVHIPLSKMERTVRQKNSKKNSVVNLSFAPETICHSHYERKTVKDLIGSQKNLT